MSGSSNLYSFRDGRQVAVQLVSRGVLSPGLIYIYPKEDELAIIRFEIRLENSYKYTGVLNV